MSSTSTSLQQAEVLAALLVTTCGCSAFVHRQNVWAGCQLPDLICLQGADITFQLQPGSGTTCGHGTTLNVYTTRPDTLFGVTYMVLAPEHPLVQQLTTPEQQQAVQQYVAAAGAKSDLERTELQKEKSGVSTGWPALCFPACSWLAAD